MTDPSPHAEADGRRMAPVYAGVVVVEAVVVFLLWYFGRYFGG